MSGRDRAEDRGGAYKGWWGNRRWWECARCEDCPRRWGLAGGTRAATGKGLRTPRDAGGRDPAAGAGLGPGQLLPARGGPRPRWRRWLRLRGSGSAAASPSQHPPPRSARAAGPRPERRGRARAGGGAPSWAERGRASASPSRLHLDAVSGCPTQCGPAASVSPPRQPLASRSACAGLPDPGAPPPPLPTPAQPGPAPLAGAPESPCAPQDLAPHPRGETHPPGRTLGGCGGASPQPRGEGSEEAACSALAAALPGVLVERRGGRSAGDNNSSHLLTAYPVLGSVLNPLRGFILASVL